MGNTYYFLCHLRTAGEKGRCQTLLTGCSACTAHARQLRNSCAKRKSTRAATTTTNTNLKFSTKET